MKTDSTFRNAPLTFNEIGFITLMKKFNFPCFFFLSYFQKGQSTVQILLIYKTNVLPVNTDELQLSDLFSVRN